MIAKIVIDISHSHVDKPFDYRVPNSLEKFVQEGMRVNVFFHGALRKGVILGFKKTSRETQLKSIESLIELTPCYSKELIDLAQMMSRKYARPLYDYLELLTPFKKRIPREVRLICDYHPEKYRDVFQGRPFVTQGFEKPQVMTGLTNHDLRLEEFKPSLDSPKLKMLSLSKELPVKGPKQQALIDLLKSHKSISAAIVKKTHKISQSTIQSLMDKGIIQVSETPRHLHRHPINTLDDALEISDGFFDRQVQWIKPGDTKNVGRFISTLISQEKPLKKTYILCPETLMAHSYFESLREVIQGVSIHDASAAFKTRLENSLRFDAFNVMIGTMHGLAAHLEAIEHVIIVDSHDANYARSLPPIFEFSDFESIMIKHGGFITHITETLSFKDHVSSQTGDLPLFDLGHSFNKQFRLIDTREHALKNQSSMITDELIKAIKDTIRQGKNSVLVHNFTGKHSHYACPICQKKATCPDCHAVLTPSDGALICDNGHETISLPIKCPECDIPMTPVFEGLDAVLEELKNLFKETPVILYSNGWLDDSYQFDRPTIFLGLNSMVKHTQIKNVGLKAILDVDRMLSVKAYDTRFQTFALLMKLTTYHPDATLYIQTNSPDHPVIRGLMDPEGFYEASLKELGKLTLPPFTEMAQVVFDVRNKPRNDYLGQNMVNYLKKALRDHVTIIGPSYKMSQGIITLKSNDLHDHYAALNNLIKAFIDEVSIEIKHAHYEV